MIIRIAWQTPMMPVPAFDYFHSGCLLQRPEFKSEAIASGKWSELQPEDVGSDAKCSHCRRNLREIL